MHNHYYKGRIHDIMAPRTRADEKDDDMPTLAEIGKWLLIIGLAFVLFTILLPIVL